MPIVHSSLSYDYSLSENILPVPSSSAFLLPRSTVHFSHNLKRSVLSVPKSFTALKILYSTFHPAVCSSTNHNSLLLLQQPAKWGIQILLSLSLIWEFSTFSTTSTLNTIVLSTATHRLASTWSVRAFTPRIRSLTSYLWGINSAICIRHTFLRAVLLLCLVYLLTRPIKQVLIMVPYCCE